MCGIVGSVSTRQVAPQLIEGLRRLEYRGYDSAGVAILSEDQRLRRERALGKVQQLADRLEKSPLTGHVGIAHTRWATHGQPSERNAHPHMSGNGLAVVHNGIIENHAELRHELEGKGFEFTSETDTEVIVHQIEHYRMQGMSLLSAVSAATGDFTGAFALGVLCDAEPDRLIAARRGSPLVIGLGTGENFIGSDAAALIPFTQQMIYLEDGDIAEIRLDQVQLFDEQGKPIDRPVRTSTLSAGALDKGGFRHYMLKEIHEQPRAIADTLEGRLGTDHIFEAAFGHRAKEIFDRTEAVHIIACGTSWHAGMVGRYWLEEIAGIPCQVEIASEFRYRESALLPNTLVVTISQSGETADTLEALREARRRGIAHSLAICNVPESSLVRESELVLMTHAGPEIGVASTKAFTTQLAAIMLLVIALGRRGKMTAQQEAELIAELRQLPQDIEYTLALDSQIETLAEQFSDKHHSLFLGRGIHYPVALEGALKLKEISYIHAEAYPAGELKHGPLALVDADMPVIAVAPNDKLLEKLKSNIQEVHARGGKLIVFADIKAGISSGELQLMPIHTTLKHLAPVIYTIPLQLLSYHVAVIKGTDVDQPRNLAKSVTVE